MNKVVQGLEVNTRTQTGNRMSRWAQFKLIAILLFVVLLTVLLFQNAEAVSVDVLLWTINMSVALVVIFSLLIGACIGAFIYGRITRKRF